MNIKLVVATIKSLQRLHPMFAGDEYVSGCYYRSYIDA